MADKFPGPYVQTIREADPFMKRVDQDHGEIGSRPAGMPGGMMDHGMVIDHVGGVATGGKK
jgi:hypothetical protein